MRILFCVGNLIFLVSPEAVIRVKIATVTYPILILETEHISASGTIEKTMHSIRSDLAPAGFWPRHGVAVAARKCATLATVSPQLSRARR